MLREAAIATVVVVLAGCVGTDADPVRNQLADARSNWERAGIDTYTVELEQLDHRYAGCRWITEEELDAQPELVRTMSVQPPRGKGSIRLLEIAGVDLQPCGGTHLKSTSEVGAVRIGKVEKKGKRNRRVNIHLDD